MKNDYTYQVDSIEKIVTLIQADEGMQASIDGHDYQISTPKLNQNVLSFFIDGRQVRATVVLDKDQVWLAINGRQWRCLRSRSDASQRRNASVLNKMDTGRLIATMPGQVTGILINIGDSVRRGQPLVLLEAMKMELRISAPYAGVVETIDCVVGEIIQQDQQLVKIIADEEHR